MPTRRTYLIELPHTPDECTGANLDAPSGDRAVTYSGCKAGTHTSWTIAELAAEEEAWRLVPRLLLDTARVIPVDSSRGARR